MDEHTAAEGVAAARLNFRIKIILFRLEQRLSLLFPYQTEVNLGELRPEIFQTNWLGLFE